MKLKSIGLTLVFLSSIAQASFNPFTQFAPHYFPNEMGAGSGYFINNQGYIATARHVANPLAEEPDMVMEEHIDPTTIHLIVIYNNKSYPATVIAEDENKDTAIIKIDAVNTPGVVLNTSPKDGDSTTSIGYPAISLQSKFTAKGFVAGHNLNFVYYTGIGCFGNSGGPVFNSHNEVIGHSDWGFTGMEGGICNALLVANDATGLVNLANSAKVPITTSNIWTRIKGKFGGNNTSEAVVSIHIMGTVLPTLTLPRMSDATKMHKD